MASSSNNSSLAPVISHRGDYYDVFVTFRGEDTSNNFIAFLVDALKRKGISVFQDDTNLQNGESIGPELIRAIERSQVFVAVFSRNYASSAWCLQELEKIWECVQGTQKHILPVFYDVAPSEVRKQHGIYGEAFAEHEQRFQQDSQMVSRWREALKEVANISGWDLRDRDQLEAINNIVEQVSRRVDRVPLHNVSSFNNIVEQVSRRVDRVSLHNISDVVPEVSRTSQSVLDVSQTDHEVAQVMMPVSHWDFKAEMAWRVVGLMSSVVGLLCYALSPSFNRLIGRWKPFKVFLYAMSSLVIFTTVLFAKQSSLSTQLAQLIKTCAIFAVLMIISAYSFVYDRAVNGKPDILSVVSNAAFALVSLSLHRLFKLECEMGIFSYFLCCFTVQLLTINWMLIFVAIIYGGPLFVMHSQSQPSRGQRSHSELAAGSGGQHVIVIPP